MAGKILSAIQFRAKTELKPIPSIYDEEISKLRDAPWDAETREIAAKLPTFDTKNSSLYRTRQKKLEGKFRLTTSQEQFLQTHDGDIDKILLFSTTEYLLHLCAAETIYCDGTSYTAPPMFNRIIYLFKYHYPRIC